MLTEQEKADGWISLFDGETLDGWAATGKDEGWTVDNGAIMCTVKGGGYLYTLEQFEDFVLSVDFKIDEGVNSGIFFRWSDLNDAVHTGIEIQILDSFGHHNQGKHACGAIYDMVAPSKNVCKPAGVWNNTTINCKGSFISIEHNGETVAHMDMNKWSEPGKNPDGTKNKFKYAWKDMPRKGHIGLQDHGGKVWFRNIKIKTL